jgi:hypothetical protein
VVLDQWCTEARGDNDRFTTIAGWKQLWREITFEGETYHWSKHYEFLKFLALPSRCGAAFELALTGYEQETANCSNSTDGRSSMRRRSLPTSIVTGITSGVVGRVHGRQRPERPFSHRVVQRSQCGVSGVGKTVVTQETGFSSSLPTGRGLFAFSTLQEAAAAVDAIASDYESHRAAARAIAVEYFDHCGRSFGTAQGMRSVAMNSTRGRGTERQQPSTRTATTPSVLDRPMEASPCRRANGSRTASVADSSGSGRHARSRALHTISANPRAPLDVAMRRAEAAEAVVAGDALARALRHLPHTAVLRCRDASRGRGQMASENGHHAEPAKSAGQWEAEAGGDSCARPV